jgi:hypothetical protein
MPPGPPAADAKKGDGKKILGLPRQQAYIFGGVAAAGIILFLLWKRKQDQAAAASSTSSGSSSGSCPDGSTPDANGNCPQDDSDLAGELATLQTELGDLQANGGGSSGGGDTTTGTTGTSGTTTGSTAATSTSGTGSTAASATPGASTSWKYPAPTGVKATSVTSKGYDVSWNPVVGPAGQKPTTYTVATYDSSGAEVDQFNSGSTSTKEYGKGGTGLKAGQTYHTNVWANGGPVAPSHGTTGNVTLPKS